MDDSVHPYYNENTKCYLKKLGYSEIFMVLFIQP